MSEAVLSNSAKCDSADVWGPHVYKWRLINLPCPCCTAVAAFLEPEKYRNTVIAIYDEVLTCNQMVKTFSAVTGIKARCNLALTCATLTFYRSFQPMLIC